MFSLVMQAMAGGGIIYSFTLFTAPWQEAFGASLRDVMLAIACLQLGVGITGPFTGWLLDRLPLRRVVLMGFCAYLAGLLLVSRVSALWQLWLIYGLLLPFAMSMMGTLAAQTMVTRWFTDRRGLALGLSAMGTNFGGMLVPLLVALWLVDVGWRDTFVYLAVLVGLLIGPAAWWVLRRSPPNVPESGSNSTAVKEGLADMVRSTRLWIPLLCFIPMNMAFSGLQFNISGFARDLGLSAIDAAHMVTLCSLSMLVGKLFFGGLGDRLDHRLLYALSAGTMMAAIIFVIVAQSYGGLVLAMVFAGLAGGGILPLMGMIMASRFPPEAFGRAMGLVMMTVTVGATSPILMGSSHDLTGSFVPVLWLLVGLIVPALLLVRWLPKPR